jgi:uncharacterized membrane protein YraQ (UPF0718 family)
LDIVSTLTYVIQLVQGGLGNLAAYLAAHVLLCLLPAFFIAGALSALIPREAVTRYLGRDAPKLISYPAAALGGFVLAVCSCTIMPLFAGIYKKGAGLGPAITFLFVGPAINILALTYTGVAIGMDIALARIILSVLFGIGIGLIMALTFSRDDASHAEETTGAFAGTASVSTGTRVFLLLLIALLIAGTLQVSVLTNDYARVMLPVAGFDRLQEALDQLVPFDPSKGEEGVSVQGAILIGLLAVIGISAWFGLNRVDEGYNRWTGISLSLIALTLFIASLRVTPSATALELRLTGKSLAVAAAMLGLLYVAVKYLDDYQTQEWLWESWRFVKQIFPLLIVGVFAVGVIRGWINPLWIQTLAGSNTVLANLMGVAFGVFMYFPTLVEVPIAKMFLSLGMHRGPLLAYLISDPELSLQSILITSSIIGRTKAWVYVAWVAVFSTLAGWLYGAWVDGMSVWMTAALLLAGFGGLLTILRWVSKRQRASASAETAESKRAEAV